MPIDTQVKIKNGVIKGVADGQLRIFRGIPYAKPPVGNLRFKRAQEASDFDGILDCTEFRSRCLQFGGGKFQRLCDSPTPASEDCLYLNVWTRAAKEEMPVFVWIHGGGQYAGEASLPDYDLTHFAQDGVVSVSFNYRLGALGFYDFSDLGPEFESNCAISDMIMALKWIRENIRAFGGDPDRVTICGQSAGGTCVMALLGSKIARQYYNRAIIMSGVYSNLSGKQIQAYNKKVFFEYSGINPEKKEELLTADYETLLKGCSCRFEGQNTDKPGMLTAGPVIDDLVDTEPIIAAQNGELADKEIMIGTCRDEGGLFDYMGITFDGWKAAMKCLELNGYGDRIKDFEKLYKPENEKKAVMDFCTDVRFFAGSYSLAKALAKKGQVYVYRFDFVTPVAKLIKIGATHTMDIAPAFNNAHSRLYKYAIHDGIVKKYLHSSFLNFIKTGDSGWESYKKDKYATMLINKKQTIAYGLREEFLELYKDMRLY